MKKKNNSIIWKITNVKSQLDSYIIGTMHVKDAKAFKRLKDMQQIIDECEVFATEFNLDEADYNLTSKGMDLPDGQTLSSLLGKKKYQKIEKIIRKSFGIDIEFFNGSIPILLVNVLTEKILSDDMQSSLDESLWIYAKEKNKISMGVETFEEQLEILSNIPLDYQLKQLKSLAKNVSSFKKQIKKTATLYEKEEIQKLFKSVKKSSGSLRKLMINNRNIKMAKRMRKLSQENSCCFAIGAGHLAGKQGILKLLKDHGLQVKPISSKS